MIKVITTFFLTALVGWSAPTDDQRIAKAYLEAHAKQNLAALMSLVEFSPTTPKEIRDLNEATFKAQLSFVVTDAQVLSLDQEDQKTLLALQRSVEPTLEVVAKLVVRFDDSKQPGPGRISSNTSFLGIKDGAYRIVTMRQKRANQALVATPTSVTSPAEQETRRP